MEVMLLFYLRPSRESSQQEMNVSRRVFLYETKDKNKKNNAMNHENNPRMWQQFCLQIYLNITQTTPLPFFTASPKLPDSIQYLRNQWRVLLDCNPELSS